MRRFSIKSRKHVLKKYAPSCEILKNPHLSPKETQVTLQGLYNLFIYLITVIRFGFQLEGVSEIKANCLLINLKLFI